MSTWFASWFNSPYYHMLYQHRDEVEAQRFMSNILRYMALDTQSHILDLACGKGRHSIYLSEQGFRVTGVDLASESIALARVSAHEGLNFEVHDMRMPFPVKDLDAVFNLFTSFGYFESEEEHLQTLQNMSDSLKIGGRLVIDFFNAHQVIQNLLAENTKEVEGISFRQRRYVRNAYITKEIQFVDKGQEYHYQEKVRAFFAADFEKMLKEVGIQVDAYFGDYELNTYDKENSPRLVVVGTKI